jgi:hypothetical protein
MLVESTVHGDSDRCTRQRRRSTRGCEPRRRPQASEPHRRAERSSCVAEHDRHDEQRSSAAQNGARTRLAWNEAWVGEMTWRDLRRPSSWCVSRGCGVTGAKRTAGEKRRGRAARAARPIRWPGIGLRRRPVAHAAQTFTPPRRGHSDGPHRVPRVRARAKRLLARPESPWRLGSRGAAATGALSPMRVIGSRGVAPQTVG